MGVLGSLSDAKPPHSIAGITIPHKAPALRCGGHLRSSVGQIDATSRVHANGFFFGEFRSVPVDVDGDGKVEINGMEMYTDLNGNVENRTPKGPQPSLEFAR